jgi:aquaporin Z
MDKLLSEFVGTFMLVSAVCGAALFTAASPENSAGMIGVSLAVGMTVLAMIYAVGHISGGHFNPAVTMGLWAGGKFQTSEIPSYIGAQVVGGACAALVFYLIASGKSDMALGNFASNGYGSQSPGKFSLGSVFLIEVVITALFLIVIIGATSAKAPAGFAPIAIGLALAALILMSIPVSNASLNPARSTATAIFGGEIALAQLWLFWVAPIIGGMLGGVISRMIQDQD